MQNIKSGNLSFTGNVLMVFYCAHLFCAGIDCRTLVIDWQGVLLASWQKSAQ